MPYRSQTTTSFLFPETAPSACGTQTRARCSGRLRTTTVGGTCRGCCHSSHAVDRGSCGFSDRIASIDYRHPFVLSGSSDKHIRLLDVMTSQGWSTSPSADKQVQVTARAVICEACGSASSGGEVPQPPPRRRAHEDLVRSVALNAEVVVSGSYDFTVKVGTVDNDSCTGKAHACP